MFLFFNLVKMTQTCCF